jgi:hypothetical protein
MNITTLTKNRDLLNELISITRALTSMERITKAKDVHNIEFHIATIKNNVCKHHYATLAGEALPTLKSALETRKRELEQELQNL